MSFPGFCSVCRGPIGLPISEVVERRQYMSREEENWCNYYRDIFQSPSPPRQFRVSEIRYRYDSAGVSFSVPGDRRAAPIKYTPASRAAHWYQFHTYRWDMTERLLGCGRDLAENKHGGKLYSLISALDSAGGGFSSGDTGNVQETELCPLGLEDFFAWVSRNPRSRLSDKEKFSMLSNPSRIPALQKILENSKKARKDLIHQVSSKTSTGAVPNNTDAIRSHGQISDSQNQVDLPPELQLLILDFLPDIIDIGNAVKAFRWLVSDSYWKSRFPCEVIHELDDVPLDRVDWEYLSTEFGGLLRQDCWGLENRFRIFRLLCDIRDLGLPRVLNLSVAVPLVEDI
ncbi:hypothetical protein FQN54_002570 [Arachnomyces sp. PD_36]|nr:hypothetical protein FQN54_002570 [Arachnomyces sp. PD_36]